VPRKTVAHVVIAVLVGITLGGIVVFARRPGVDLPPLPAPPTIAAARGDLPAGVIAFEERVQRGDGYYLGGSGFLLELQNGDVIGVTTAHSMGEGDFTRVVFTRAGHERPVAAFSELYVPRGRPATQSNMTTDYVLMKPEASPDPDLVLEPDPRGAPQPGERVSLHSGLGDGRGGERRLHATVESVDGSGAWLRMDEVFDSSLMSGSPVLSQHTGRVVGVTVFMHWIPDTLRIGINPIGEIVKRAREAPR
jgi:hypothetical protein